MSSQGVMVLQEALGDALGSRAGGEPMAGAEKRGAQACG